MLLCPQHFFPIWEGVTHSRIILDSPLPPMFCFSKEVLQENPLGVGGEGGGGWDSLRSQ